MTKKEKMMADLLILIAVGVVAIQNMAINRKIDRAMDEQLAIAEKLRDISRRLNCILAVLDREDDMR